MLRRQEAQLAQRKSPGETAIVVQGHQTGSILSAIGNQLH